MVLEWLLNVSPIWWLSSFVVLFFTWLASKIKKYMEQGPDPFEKDHRRPPAPLVTDKAERKARLKQVFAMKKVPEQLDAIVIGSGIGGMACSSFLSKAGKRVLVLEQHTRAGGCCHTFKEKGYEFDVGIHYVGSRTPKSDTRFLANFVTDGQLVWDDMDSEYDIIVLHRADGSSVRVPLRAGRQQLEQGLLEVFPCQQKAIQQYFEDVQKTRNAMSGVMIVKFLPLWLVRIIIKAGLLKYLTKFFEFCRESTDEYFDRLTDDDDLKAVLSYNYGDIGTLPDEEPITMQQSLFSHFQNGASYPRGGASEIAFHVIPTIEKSGGKVLVRAPVSKILLDASNKAVGVRIVKGGETFDIHAPIVISACGIPNTYTKLLPENVARNTEIGRLLSQNRVRPGYGFISLFIGFNASAQELGLKSQNFWIINGNRLSQDVRRYLSLNVEEAMDTALPLLFISFPSTKDSSHEQRYPDKTTCTVISISNYEWFQEWNDERVKHRGARYEEVKDAITQRLWEGVCHEFPQLKNKMDYMELGSPLSNNFYLGATRGEIYGLDHDMSRFDPLVQAILRPESGVSGLWLTGQDILSCGFSGAITAGLLTAAKILNRNIISDITRFQNRFGVGNFEPSKTSGSAMCSSTTKQNDGEAAEDKALANGEGH